MALFYSVSVYFVLQQVNISDLWILELVDNINLSFLIDLPILMKIF